MTNVPLSRRMSVRVTLILWSVGILTLSLFAFGGVLRWQTERDILASVDADLFFFAHDNGGPHRRDGRGPDGRDGRDGRSGRGGRDRPEPGPESGPQGERGPRPPQNASVEDGQNRRQPFWRREWTSGGAALPAQNFGPPDNSGLAKGAAWDSDALQKAREEKRDLYSTVVLETVGSLRVYSFPAPGDADNPPRMVQMARPLADLQWAISRLTRTLLLLVAPFLLFAGMGGAFLASRVLRPVRDMARAAGALEGQLSGRLPISGRDEFADLAITFNALLSRIDAAFARQKRFTGDASHELRTPLAVIRAHTSLVLSSDKERTPEQYRKTLQSIDKAAQNATKLVQDLLVLARADTDRLELSPVPLRIAPLLYEAVQAVEMAASGDTASIEIAADDALCVRGDAPYLVRLVTNLVENAVRYTPQNGQIRVCVQEKNHAVHLTVEDTGEGIAACHLPHLGERFYRADDSRDRNSGGSGLGLALCKSIAEAHGGTLGIESDLGVGTCVTVVLPLA